MKKITALKKEIGWRFRQFRAAIHKSQLEVAEEVKVSQSAIANIEGGKAYPNLAYLYHFYNKYRLNNIWLMTGDGEMFLKEDKVPDKYLELFNLLQIPLIEQMINAKLIETRILLKDNIKAYFENKEKTGTGQSNGTI
jgi:transcriptional regulator with XRE-family HTH domain